MTEKTPIGSVTNYVTTNHFYVEIDNTIVARFSECSGIGVQIKKVTYLEGGVNDQQRIFLGHAEFPDVTLKRGITDDPAFFHWLGEIFNEASTKASKGAKIKGKRRNVNITLHNQAGDIMLSWTLIGSIPIAWKTSKLLADGNSVAIEELTVAIEGLKIGQSSTGGGLADPRDSNGFIASSDWELKASDRTPA